MPLVTTHKTDSSATLKPFHLFSLQRLNTAAVILSLALLLSSCQRSTSKEQPWSGSATAQSPRLILIDAGHGGRDKGTVNNRARVEEKELCLRTAKIVQKKLKQMGYPTRLLRDRDEFVSLNKRITSANSHGDALFVSIHFNSAPNKLAQGIEVYYSDNKDLPKRIPLSKQLAESILKSAVERTGAPSRGVKIGSYRVIKNTHIPACLIEGGFVTNRSEVKKLAQTRYLERLAEGIAQGVDNYCHLQETSQPALNKLNSKTTQ